MMAPLASRVADGLRQVAEWRVDVTPEMVTEVLQKNGTRSRRDDIDLGRTGNRAPGSTTYGDSNAEDRRRPGLATG